MADDIILKKPLGSDIYDLEVFNENFAIIEEYLKKANIYLLKGGSGVRCIFYPGDESSIDINNLDIGIHIVDNIQDIKGTFPTQEDKSNFEILSFGKAETSQFQLFVGLVTGSLYYRTQLPNIGLFTDWAPLGDGGGDSPNPDINYSVGLRVRYPSTINIDTAGSGIYICRGTEITGGALPTAMQNSTEFQLISYGSTQATGTQTIVDMTNGKNLYYSRIRYIDTAGNLITTPWMSGGIGGSGVNIKISVVDI